MNTKTALIAGLEGQDGYYLSRFLSQKGYQVYGIVRKKATHEVNPYSLPSDAGITKIFSDITDFTSVLECMKIAQPCEVYNLAGQSDIPISWKEPFFTTQVNAFGPVLLLEAIKSLGLSSRFFQASSSEMYGSNQGGNLDENSYFAPRNPYGTAKLFAHWATINYRESYGMHSLCGILFNHESVRRGFNFVTRKISSSVAKISLGMLDCLEIGNLDAVRDWGHAEDYVRAMWLILQQNQPEEYVIATGQGHCVRDFVTAAFKSVGIDVCWKGDGLNEKGHDKASGKLIVVVNPAFYRFPKEDIIVGNPAKLLRNLDFRHEYSFQQLVDQMVANDLAMLKRGIS